MLVYCSVQFQVRHAVSWRLREYQRLKGKSLTCLGCLQMLSLFLFLAAAVPVLGDAQINRQTDAAVKRYRDRQGNRNKIIVEESVPSCPKSSGTFERSQLDMELLESTELFGHPGGQYRSGCCQQLVGV